MPDNEDQDIMEKNPGKRRRDSSEERTSPSQNTRSQLEKRRRDSQESDIAQQTPPSHFPYQNTRSHGPATFPVFLKKSRSRRSSFGSLPKDRIKITVSSLDDLLEGYKYVRDEKRTVDFELASLTSKTEFNPIFTASRGQGTSELRFQAKITTASRNFPTASGAAMMKYDEAIQAMREGSPSSQDSLIAQSLLFLIGERVKPESGNVLRSQDQIQAAIAFIGIVFIAEALRKKAAAGMILNFLHKLVDKELTEEGNILSFDDLPNEFTFYSSAKEGRLQAETYTATKLSNPNLTPISKGVLERDLKTTELQNRKQRQIRGDEEEGEGEEDQKAFARLSSSGSHFSPPRGSSLRGSSLRGSSLRGSSLRGSPLRGSPLRGSPLRGSSREMTFSSNVQSDSDELLIPTMLFAQSIREEEEEEDYTRLRSSGSDSSPPRSSSSRSSFLPSSSSRSSSLSSSSSRSSSRRMTPSSSAGLFVQSKRKSKKARKQERNSSPIVSSRLSSKFQSVL